ncbi:MAG: hypothetical protein HKM23_07230 [Nitrosopumilus sp.]|nr:hypothetical protein [Nitrosopumilus sp.]NNL59494.1 hypothetical protein [Nitrosopumilus sp.]
MSHEYYRRGKNWFTAIGVLFCVMGGIVIVQQLLIWGVDFFKDFLFNAEVTNEKVSVAMIGFGLFMIALGFRKHEQKG